MQCGFFVPVTWYVHVVAELRPPPECHGSVGNINKRVVLIRFLSFCYSLSVCLDIVLVGLIRLLQLKAT